MQPVSGAQANPYIVIDANDGAIILKNHAADKWYPASLTKLMSVYVTMKAIADGEIGLGSPVRISKRAHKMPPSRMGYKIGTVIRIDTAMKILIVKSANDIAIALAESVAGSVEAFAERMNSTAKKLGMRNSHFTNPNGLFSARQYSSARDLALLSRQILIEFPQYARWFSIPAIKTSKRTYYSYNILLERFPGTIGMKTGYVCASGYNMVATAKRHGRTLIAVVLGEKSQIARANFAAGMLTKAFGEPLPTLGNIKDPDQTFSAAPKNLRSVFCNKKALKTRYEPGAGLAVIKTGILSVRKKSNRFLSISIGGISDKPSKAYAQRLLTPHGRIPIPKPRPGYTPPLPIEGVSPTVSHLRGTIPLPTQRPRT